MKNLKYIVAHEDLILGAFFERIDAIDFFDKVVARDKKENHQEILYLVELDTIEKVLLYHNGNDLNDLEV